jgi:thiamine kinase-like enzyme
MQTPVKTLTLDQAIARLPHWAGRSDIKASSLSGGITNSNYRIDVDGESFVLRIAGADTELLGIDREHEYRANLAAGELGVAPEVFYFIRPEGYLVTRFIDGRPLLPDEMRKPESLRRVMQVVRQIHAMPEIPGRFDVFRVVEQYSEIARRYKVAFPENFAWLLEQVQAAEKALRQQPLSLCPCHNDLLNANFLVNTRLYILDWEYAGMGDRFFDLANFSDHHQLNDEQDRWLLECYFGRVLPGQWAHLKLMKMLSDLREATWALVQIGISQLDFDFRDYANQFFGRVVEKTQNPDWNVWLKEVSTNV